MERLETQTCNGDSTSFEKEMLALLDEQIFLTDSVFARLPMGVEIYDASGILRCLNERARLMYGVKLDAVINKVNLFESPYVDEALLARIQSGDDIVLEFEYDFDRMNKEYFHTSNKDTIIYEVKIVPIINKQGTIVGHILLTNDVTSTKEAEYRTEESKKNLEMAMEAANMGIRRVQNGVRDLAWKLCFQKWYVLGAIVTDASSAGLRSVKGTIFPADKQRSPAGAAHSTCFQ